MNKLLVALLAGGVIFGGVFALAAGLTVNSQGLASGTDTVAACDDSVDVSYDTAFSGGAYVVDQIIVEGIATECIGEELNLTVIVDGSPTSFSVTIDAATEAFSTSLDPALITDAFVLIGGNAVEG